MSCAGDGKIDPPTQKATARQAIAKIDEQRIGIDTRLITPVELRELAPTIWSEDLELAASPAV